MAKVGTEDEGPPLCYRMVDPDKADDLQCGICFQILDTPRQCQNGHAFCYKCITQAIEQNGATCPHCRVNLDKTKLGRSLFLEKYLREEEVWCRWHYAVQKSSNSLAYQELVVDKDGCNEKCTIEKVRQHEVECPFRIVRCQFSKECGELRAANIIEHAKVCEFRPSECRHCRIEVSFKDMERHTLQCPQAPVQCQACGLELRRHMLEQHQFHECQEKLQLCTFSDCGCDVKVLRKDIKAHVEGDLINHIMMMKKTFIRELERQKTYFQMELKKRDEKLERLMSISKGNETRLHWVICDWKTQRKKPYLQSRKFSYSGFTWFIGMYTDGDSNDSEGFLSVYLFMDLESQLPVGKHVALDYYITFRNHKDLSKSLKMAFSSDFPIKGGQGWGDRHALRSQKVTEANGFVHSGKVEIEITIYRSHTYWEI
mmetsp:Transcript_25322/g.28168  ORF Transcript_25322/g.28168 Transcript_25322/m.28168 type:complete len:428 (+) Transcript_25322:94-1377(+)